MQAAPWPNAGRQTNQKSCRIVKEQKNRLRCAAAVWQPAKSPYPVDRPEITAKNINPPTTSKTNSKTASKGPTKASKKYVTGNICRAYLIGIDGTCKPLSRWLQPTKNQQHSPSITTCEKYGNQRLHVSKGRTALEKQRSMWQTKIQKLPALPSSAHSRIGLG